MRATHATASSGAAEQEPCTDGSVTGGEPAVTSKTTRTTRGSGRLARPRAGVRARFHRALLVAATVAVALVLPAVANAAPLPSSVKLAQWEPSPNGSDAWITGNLGSGNSDYKEGESIPFRLDVGGVSAGSYTFSICRNYTKTANGVTAFGYLSLTAFNASRAAVPGAPITNSIGPITGAGVTITNVVEVGGQGGCSAGDRETQVTFTSTGAATAYVLWGGHLASPLDPGVGQGHSASFFPGSSLR